MPVKSIKSERTTVTAGRRPAGATTFVAVFGLLACSECIEFVGYAYHKVAGKRVVAYVLAVVGCDCTADVRFLLQQVVGFEAYCHGTSAQEAVAASVAKRLQSEIFSFPTSSKSSLAFYPAPPL